MSTETVVKYVLNRCYGGYGLSQAAVDWINANGGEAEACWDGSSYSYHNDRSNHVLVACVEALGDLASAPSAKLAVSAVHIEVDIIEIDGYEREVQVSGWEG